MYNIIYKCDIESVCKKSKQYSLKKIITIKAVVGEPRYYDIFLASSEEIGKLVC